MHDNIKKLALNEEIPNKLTIARHFIMIFLYIFIMLICEFNYFDVLPSEKNYTLMFCPKKNYTLMLILQFPEEEKFSKSGNQF
jgi:phosphatidylglycerophosphate synthase